MKIKIIIALVLALLCLSSCAPESIYCPATDDTTNSVIITCPDFTKSDKTASFADNLMKLTAADGNRMVSPYSAKMCLALLANGTDGETKAQILKAIGIDDLDKYNADVEALLARYATYAGVMSLETANSLWLNQTIFDGKGAFLAPYREAMQKYYSAEVREVTSKNSVEEVNAWVNEKTKEKIPTILAEDHRDFATALVNAVYFKAGWETEFSEYLTKEKDFNNIDGTKTKLDFMHNTDYYGYYETDSIKAVKIDYGKWGGETFVSDKDYDFSMYIMLGEDVNVEEFLNNSSFESTRVALAIPKFEFEYSVGLTDILKALGITHAFDEVKADLGKMININKLNGNLFVSDVLQKTYIGVDEKGTEAAAVTAIIANLTSAPINLPDPIEFTADKPFYFAIRDNTSGELLFVGRYETGK